MIDIKSRRIELGLTLEEVGDKVGVGKSTVRKWENGIIDNMKRDKIALLADALKISPIELLYDEPDQPKEAINIISIYNQLESPRQTKVYNFAEYQLEEQDKVVGLTDYIEETLLGYISAGSGKYLSDDVNETVSIPKSLVPDQKYDMVLQVNGNSMEPMFTDKEYVFVRCEKDLRSGQIGVFIIDGESYIKKAYVEDDGLRLVSLNKEYNDLVFNDINDITVIGTVVM